jgi:hypothetical protein
MTNAETMFFTGYATFAVAVALAGLLMRWQLEISKITRLGNGQLYDAFLGLCTKTRGRT